MKKSISKSTSIYFSIVIESISNVSAYARINSVKNFSINSIANQSTANFSNATNDLINVSIHDSINNSIDFLIKNSINSIVNESINIESIIIKSNIIKSIVFDSIINISIILKKSTVFYIYKFIQLNKSYKIEKKFEKTKNNLQFKFIVFCDKCKRVELSKNAYFMIASIMLKNQTFIFYYNDDHHIS